MWALLDDSDNITEIIAHPKSLVINDIRHPKALFSAWTDAERKAIGIVPVTTTGSHLDIKYYIEKNEAFAVAGDKRFWVVNTKKSHSKCCNSKCCYNVYGCN